MQMRKKIQLRWLLPIDRRHAYGGIKKLMHVRQGYLGRNMELRVRVTDDTSTGEQIADVTRTTGSGRARLEGVVRRIESAVAHDMLESAVYGIENTRHVLDGGWKVDHLFGPLDSFILVELDVDRPDAKIELPRWLDGAIEVTDWLTKRHLAYLAADLKEGQTLHPSHVIARKRMKRIAITGGAGAGKTTLIDTLIGEIGGRAHFLPEIASIVILQAKTLPPTHDPVLMRNFQHGVYRIQCGFEDVSTLQVLHDGKLVLLTDRGTVDNAAFLHGGIDEFCQLTGLSLAEQYDRYDAVLMVALPPREVYERIKGNNRARSETYEQTAEQSRRIREVWGGHPSFHYVDGATMEEKIENARDTLRALVPGIYDPA